MQSYQKAVLAKGIERTVPIGAQEVSMDEEACRMFVRLRKDPKRFVPQIFEGDWSDPKARPKKGKARFLVQQEGADGGVYNIVRQGRFIYAHCLND